MVSVQHHAPAALTQGKKHGTRWVEGWVGPTAGLGVLEKRQISCRCWNSNLGSSLYWLSYWKGCGRKQLWCNCTHYRGMCLQPVRKARNPESGYTVYGPRFEAGTSVTSSYHWSKAEFQHPPEPNSVNLNGEAARSSETSEHIPHNVKIKSTIMWTKLLYWRAWSTALWHV
jgi:hypothetical protein